MRGIEWPMKGLVSWNEQVCAGRAGEDSACRSKESSKSECSSIGCGWQGAGVVGKPSKHSWGEQDAGCLAHTYIYTYKFKY